MHFNPAPSRVMHIDINSCFATIEQQANPLLRGKPIAVAAYDSPGGCILAASLEAKVFGVKTGMRVKEGKLLCPNLLVITPDPDKYRQVHLAMRRILADYTNEFSPKSIDEFVLSLAGYPAEDVGLGKTAQEIKSRIRKEIGEWISVSVGIAPNRFLAKTASNLKKPDGLEEINKDNYMQVFSGLELTDLTGIAHQNRLRLNSVGIYSVVDFYQSPLWRLKAAFASIGSYYWYLRLRGYEIDGVEFGRRSFGNSYALPSHSGKISELFPILQKLCEKTGMRLRRAGYRASGIRVSLVYKKGGVWNKSELLRKTIFDSRQIYIEAMRILGKCPYCKPVHTLAVSCFALTNQEDLQLELFEDQVKKRKLVDAVDTVNEKWGDFVVSSAGVLKLKSEIHDRIAFGGVREL